jgi:hypothetical protein
MSGNYATENQDAPGGLGDTAAAVRAGVASAQAAADTRQADAHRFIVENGHDVVGGHADVGHVNG